MYWKKDWRTCRLTGRSHGNGNGNFHRRISQEPCPLRLLMGSMSIH